MAIANALKVEVRRHLKYPLTGSPTNGMTTGTTGQAGGIIGFRYFEYMPLLEYRMNNISADEEVSLLGPLSQFFGNYWTPATAKVTVSGTPVPGESPTLQINGFAAQYTVGSGDAAKDVATGLATAVNVNASLAVVIIAQAVGPVVTITSRALGSMANTLAISPFATPSVSLLVTNQAGAPAYTLQNGQDPPGPFWIDPTQSVSQPYFGYLPIIRYHESQLPNALSGMDTVKAGPFLQRQDELAARAGAYQFWCRRLAQFFAIPYEGAGTYDRSGPSRRVS